MKTKIKRNKYRVSVFEEAARLIGEGEMDCGCFALQEAAGLSWLGDDCPEIEYFERVLRPPNPLWELWYRCDEKGCYVFFLNDEPFRTPRILGLLLCAELVKEGFRPPPRRD